MAQRGDAELFEVALVKDAEHLGIDVVGQERRGVLRKADLCEPSPDIHPASPSNSVRAWGSCVLRRAGMLLRSVFFGDHGEPCEQADKLSLSMCVRLGEHR